MIKLDIGCGERKKSREYIGVDIVPVKDADVVCDIDEGMPMFNDNSVDEIFCSHFLEHSSNPIKVCEEFYRILKPGGKLEVVVPHFSNPNSCVPEHKTYWNIKSFNSFDKTKNWFGYKMNFEIIDLRYEFTQKLDRSPTIWERVAMVHRGWIFETRICNFIHACQIRATMIKKEMT